MSRQYYGIEAINLTLVQRQTLVDALQRLGANQHPNPSHRCHWRVRLDNLAVIFEAEFDDADWTVDGVKTRLANLLGINANLVTSAVSQTQYGPVVTYSRSGDRLRLVAFGGLLATWDESHDQVLAYLAANTSAWDAS
jgi:hypothetical protein